MVVSEPEIAARVDTNVIVTHCSIWALECSHNVG